MHISEQGTFLCLLPVFCPDLKFPYGVEFICLLAGGEDKVEDKDLEKEYEALCAWMTKSLGEKVAKVQVSKRSTSAPCVLVSAKFGWSANMER